MVTGFLNGGDVRITADPLHAKQVLYQRTANLVMLDGAELGKSQQFSATIGAALRLDGGIVRFVV